MHRYQKSLSSLSSSGTLTTVTPAGRTIPAARTACRFIRSIRWRTSTTVGPSTTDDLRDGTTMPRRRLAVTVTAMIVALSGCTVNVNVPATDATTPASGPATTTTAAAETPTYAFVGVVREKLPELGEGRTDDEVQAMADVICNALAKDAKSEDVVDATRSLGSRDGVPIDVATANEVIKLAIDTSCLAQAPRVTEF
jgi:hypothetical protein